MKQQITFRLSDIRRRFKIESDRIIDLVISNSFGVTSSGMGGEHITFSGSYENIANLQKAFLSIDDGGAYKHNWFDISHIMSNPDTASELFTWLLSEGRSYTIDRRFTSDTSIRFDDMDHQLAFSIRFLQK